MSNSIAPVNQVALLPFVRGDLWDGIAQLGPVTYNDLPIPSPLARVDLHFRKAWDDKAPAYALSSQSAQGQGTITIVNATTWFCTVPAQALPLRPGVWKWDVQYTAQDGTVLTPVGGTLVVSQDITRLSNTEI